MFITSSLLRRRRRCRLAAVTTFCLLLATFLILAVTVLFDDDLTTLRHDGIDADRVRSADGERNFLVRVLSRVASSLRLGFSATKELRLDDEAPTCVLPNLQLWHPEIKGYFTDPKPLDCPKAEENWVYSINGTFLISSNAVAKHGQINCKYIPITRLTGDDGVERGLGVQPMPNGSVLTSDVFEARCVAADGQVQAMVLSGIAPKSEVKQRKPEITSSSSGNPLKLDVLMFGFDSVSRMTWLRNLPKSYAYFRNYLGAVVLEGYNIVGDGTPQALLPMLTGKTEQELPEARRGFRDAKSVDGHPWIWDEFKRNGYATQWGEDSAEFGTFTMRMLGFKNQPVDHYMRTFYIEAEKHYKKYFKTCLGSLPRHLNMLNWMKDFIDVYRDQRKFSFVFHAEYSHGGYSELQLADEDLLNFLRYLNNEGHLDKAILILMSDHGARFQKLRQTEQGKLEERLPFFGIRLPPVFVKAYPEIARNLEINSQRLTTPFDIHETFLDIVNFEYFVKSSRWRKKVTPEERGISLFREVPRTRTCEQAGIEAHWCSCLSWKNVSLLEESVMRAGKDIVSEINKITESNRELCATVRLDKTVAAVQYRASDQVLKFLKSNDSHGRIPDLTDKMNISEVLYQVTVMTQPGGGLFEATVRRTLLDDKLFVRRDSISRINRYKTQPHCIAKTLPHLRPYCYCHKQLEDGGGAPDPH